MNRREFLQSSVMAGAFLTLNGRVFGKEGAAKAKPDPNKKLLILGGTVYLGPELVEAAKAKGWTITLFNRGKTNPQLFPELEKLHGDRKNDLKSLEGRKWDVVIDTSGYVPRHVHDSATLLKDNVGQYVFISTISVYSDMSKPGIDESSPVGKIEDETTEKVTNESYGPLKALCEQAAEKAMPGRTLNIRPGLIVGPNDPTDRYTYWPVRVARGGNVLAPGDGSDPVQYIDVRDLAEWTIRMIEAKNNGVYIANGPKDTQTIKQLLETCKAVSKSDASFTWAENKFLEAQQVSAWGDMPVWIPAEGETLGANRVNCAKAISKGLTFRSAEVTAKDTLNWWNTLPEERRKKLKSGISPEREKEVLEAWRKAYTKH